MKTFFFNNTLLLLLAFGAVLCLPQNVSAQWTDGGAYMTTNDNVAIGTTNNTYTLYARTDKAGWQGRFANRAGSGSDVYLSHGAGYGMHIRGWTNDGKYTLQLYNKTKQTNVFYNNGIVGLGLAGNVGIGRTNPNHKLHVEGDGRIKNVYIGSNPGGGGFHDGVAGLYNLHLNAAKFNGVGGNVVFLIDGTQEMVLNPDGNLGIGTTSPDNKLDVNGTIRAKEIKVQTGWSDYVFYDDYQLPTLEEEEAHIEAKGHLLGFESEADMGGEANLGDVAKRQQAKIEEMMLHLIEMKKEIEQLKKENEQLKK